jgi:predicted DNA-binding transcriptional regulator YafY
MSFEEQTARIERLICLIESTKTGTANELAQKVGVSRRTLFRDLDFLKGKGLQIVFNHLDKSFKFEIN